MEINFRKYLLRLMKTSLKPWRDQNIESLSLENFQYWGKVFHEADSAATINILLDSKTFLRLDTLNDTTGPDLDGIRLQIIRTRNRHKKI